MCLAPASRAELKLAQHDWHPAICDDMCTGTCNSRVCAIASNNGVACWQRATTAVAFVMYRVFKCNLLRLALPDSATLCCSEDRVLSNPSFALFHSYSRSSLALNRSWEHLCDGRFKALPSRALLLCHSSGTYTIAVLAVRGGVKVRKVQYRQWCSGRAKSCAYFC